MRTASDEIDRATIFSQRLENLVGQKNSVTLGPAGNRAGLLLAYWSVAFDIDKGILALLQHKFYAGAFALIRPLVETQLRAHVVIMGSDADVARIASDDYQVNFKTIGSEIDKSFGMNGYTERFLDQSRDVLHSFTHSGLAQLGRRFEGNDLVAHYNDEEIIELIHIATTSVFLVSVLVTGHFKFEDERKRTNELMVEWGRPH
jgi:hypothetical protein